MFISNFQDVILNEVVGKLNSNKLKWYNLIILIKSLQVEYKITF